LGGVRFSPALVLGLTALLLIAGCGYEATPIRTAGATSGDEATAREVRTEIERRFEGSIDLEQLPPEQRDLYDELLDNIYDIPRVTESVSVERGVVEVEASLNADAEGRRSARLICGAVFASAGVAEESHRVVDTELEPLHECERSDRNYP
jgi:hypothetical protein